MFKSFFSNLTLQLVFYIFFLNIASPATSTHVFVCLFVYRTTASFGVSLLKSS